MQTLVNPGVTQGTLQCCCLGCGVLGRLVPFTSTVPALPQLGEPFPPSHAGNLPAPTRNLSGGELGAPLEAHGAAGSSL